LVIHGDRREEKFTMLADSVAHRGSHFRGAREATD
jgi:hypothetical protein